MATKDHGDKGNRPERISEGSTKSNTKPISEGPKTTPPPKPAPAPKK